MVGEQWMVTPPKLIVPQVIWDDVLAHLRTNLPNEGVGLLGCDSLGEGGETEVRAQVFYPGRNVKASPTRFDLDMRDLVHALQDMEERGLQLGAIVHSHPLGAPTPSETDLREAYYPESLMVIVSFAGLTPVARAWRLQPADGGWKPDTVLIEVVSNEGVIADSG